jgi:hypothetical protein
MGLPLVFDQLPTILRALFVPAQRFVRSKARKSKSIVTHREAGGHR